MGKGIDGRGDGVGDGDGRGRVDGRGRDGIGDNSHGLLRRQCAASIDRAVIACCIQLMIATSQSGSFEL